jgi:hypothetical protein
MGNNSFEIVEGLNKEEGDESQAMLESILKKSGLNHVVEPLELCEISFHTGWLNHRAGLNTTDRMRKVMTMIYIDKNMTFIVPENKNQQVDWSVSCHGAVVGEVIDTHLNPKV